MRQVDRMVRWVEKNALFLGLTFALLLILVYFYRDPVFKFIDAENPKKFLQILTALFGPPVTAAGFYLGWRAKRDMAKHSAQTLDRVTALGAQQAAAEGRMGELKESNRRSTDEIAIKASEIRERDLQIASKSALIEQQQRQLARLSEGQTTLWTANTLAPFEGYKERFHDPKTAWILTVANMKGGVGKSMLASMIAGYASSHLKKRVLLIDLDFQGSVTGIMLLGCGLPEVASRAEKLLGPGDGKSLLDQNRIHLDSELPRCWLIPANYTYAEAENHLLFKYVMNAANDTDPRFRLAEVLLDARTCFDYDIIVIDTPPRLSLGTVNALTASHGLIIPTILDKLSNEAVERFLAQAGVLKKTLSLDLRFIGLVGTMSLNAPPVGAAEKVWEDLAEITNVWGEVADFRLGVLPRRADIANAVGETIPYFAARDLFNPIGERIFARLEEPVEEAIT